MRVDPRAAKVVRGLKRRWLNARRNTSKREGGSMARKQEAAATCRLGWPECPWARARARGRAPTRSTRVLGPARLYLLPPPLRDALPAPILVEAVPARRPRASPTRLQTRRPICRLQRPPNRELHANRKVRMHRAVGSDSPVHHRRTRRADRLAAGRGGQNECDLSDGGFLEI